MNIKALKLNNYKFNVLMVSFISVLVIVLQLVLTQNNSIWGDEAFDTRGRGLTQGDGDISVSD